MTNYDRWKLATPNYLEDEDDRAISGVHGEIFDGETDLTYTQAYGVIRRMREKSLITDIKKTDIAGSFNAKRYGLLMDPVEFLKEERAQNQSPPPPAGFFNNPFNLKNAKE
jgi:hypothetical protein